MVMCLSASELRVTEFCTEMCPKCTNGAFSVNKSVTGSSEATETKKVQTMRGVELCVSLFSGVSSLRIQIYLAILCSFYHQIQWGKNRMADSWIISLKSIGVCRQCDYCLESHDLGKAVRGLWWAVFCSRVPDLVLMGGTEVGPLILMTTLSDSSLT